MAKPKYFVTNFNVKLNELVLAHANELNDGWNGPKGDYSHSFSYDPETFNMGYTSSPTFFASHPDDYEKGSIEEFLRLKPHKKFGPIQVIADKFEYDGAKRSKEEVRAFLDAIDLLSNNGRRTFRFSRENLEIGCLTLTTKQYADLKNFVGKDQ